MNLPRPNGQHAFELSLSSAIADKIRRFQRRATREGRGEAFLQAVRTAVERLQYDPRQFGDPLYRLEALRMEIRGAAVRPLYIDFAICDDRPLVIVKAVKLFSAQRH